MTHIDEHYLLLHLLMVSRRKKQRFTSAVSCFLLTVLASLLRTLLISLGSALGSNDILLERTAAGFGSCFRG